MPDFASPEFMALASLATVWFIERLLKLLKHRGVDLQRMARQMNRLDKLWDQDAQIKHFSEVTHLVDLHDVRGEDGVPVWYVRASDQRALNNALNALAESSKAQTILLQAMLADMKAQRKESEDAHKLIIDVVKNS